jgi:hypothetical protein
MTVVDTNKIGEWKTRTEAEYDKFKQGKNDTFNEGSVVNTFYEPLTKMTGILKPMYDDMNVAYEELLNMMAGVSSDYVGWDSGAGYGAGDLNNGLSPDDTVSNKEDSITIIDLNSPDMIENPDIIEIPTDGTTDGSDNPLRGETLNAPDTTFLEFFEEFCTEEYYGTGTVVEFMSRFMDLSADMFGTLNSTDGSGNPRPGFMEYFNECTEVKQVNSLGDPYNAVNSLDEYLKNYKTLKNGSAFGVDKMTFEKYYEEFINQNPEKNSFENVFSSYFEYIKD